MTALLDKDPRNKRVAIGNQTTMGETLLSGAGVFLTSAARAVQEIDASAKVLHNRVPGLLQTENARTVPAFTERSQARRRQECWVATPSAELAVLR